MSEIKTWLKLMEAEIVPYKEQTIEPDDVYDVDWKTAKDVLDRHPDGAVVFNDDIFETNSFIYINNKGEYKFWHSYNNTLMEWDWKSDLQSILDDDMDSAENVLNSGWCVQPASDFFAELWGMEQQKPNGLEFVTSDKPHHFQVWNTFRAA